MSNLELLDRAASATTCQFLSTFGSALVGAAVYPLWTPKGQAVALTAGGLSLLASNYLCPDMPMGDAPPPDDAIDGCGQMAPGGYGQFQYLYPGGDWQSASGKPEYQTATGIGEISYFPRQDGSWSSSVEVISNGSTVLWQSPDDELSEEQAKATKFRILPIEGECDYDPDTDIPPYPPEIHDPIPYFDSITNCNYNLSFQGFAQEGPGQAPNPVWQVIGTGQASGGRSEGGRMGGCNFGPIIYMPQPGGGGPGFYIPVPPVIPPPNGGVPWWWGPLLGGSVSAALNLIGSELAGLTEPIYEAGTFTLTAPCDYTEEGDNVSYFFPFPKGNFAKRVIDHQMAILDVLQYHLNSKTPTCDCEPSTPEGDFRTISFRSDETSPYGKSRLRKRFRYRSVSGNDLGAVVDHWKDFSFEGGPYRVRWVGGSWRSPEIWAASEAEGQRVIQHAAQEAGVSPLEGGRWSTRLSGSGRQGVPGTMRVDTTKGFYWITARDGSSERPIVATAWPE